MGKKNKIKLKYQNDWNLSADEQKKHINELDMLQNGSITIDQFVNDEKLIEKPVCDMEKQLVEFLNSTPDLFGEKDDEIIVPEKEEAEYINTPVSDYVDNYNEIQEADPIGAIMDDLSIKFNYNNELDKLVIDDGVSPKTFAVDKAVYDDIYDDVDFDDKEQYDHEFFINTTILLYAYIITCMHPCAVIPNAIFDKEFRDVKSFDTSKFTFVSVDDFILVYVVNTDEGNKLFEIPSTYDANRTEHMSFWISLAYWCGTVNNAFYIESKDYIVDVMNMCEKKDNYSKFKELFFSDAMTVVEKGADKIYSLIEDAEYVQYKAREFMMSVADIDDGVYDTNDDDDDSTETDVIISAPTETESEPIVITEDIWKTAYKHLLHEANELKSEVSDKPEEPDVNENVNTSVTSEDNNIEVIEISDDDDDSMIVPVIT